MTPVWPGGGWAARAVMLLAMVAALMLSIGFAVSIGEIGIPLAVTAKAVGNRLFGMDYPLSRIQEGIIWDYRMSRALLAACCGGGLAVSGAVLQALLRNPLAEPYILGISAGASTGAVLVVVLGLGGGIVSMSGGAFAGAGLALALVAIIAAGSGGASDRIILAGVAAAQLFNALTSYIVTTAASAEQARSIMFWLLGNLSGARWADVLLAAPVVVGAVGICLLYANALDAFHFGADAAASLGVATGRVRLVLFAVTAAITATLVSLVGSIGFVGLVIPQTARFLVGPAHARLLPASFLIGAIFTVVADILSRILIPQQTLPIGVVTALIGAPAFAVILFRSRGAR